MSQIQVSQFNTVYTITFINHSQDGMEDATPTTWVCQNKAAYERALRDLSQLWHIKVLQSGQSHFISAPSGCAIPVA